MQKIIAILITIIIAEIHTISIQYYSNENSTEEENNTIRYEWVELEEDVILPATEEITVEPILTIQQDEELQLMSKVVFGEAGNQDEIGKRLVIDCILNRLDAGFADSITDVLYQKNQFDVIGEINNYPVDEYIYNLILEEMDSRYNSEVLYFRSGHYHNFGTPVLQHQAHYFSK